MWFETNKQGYFCKIPQANVTDGLATVQAKLCFRGIELASHVGNPSFDLQQCKKRRKRKERRSTRIKAASGKMEKLQKVSYKWDPNLDE